MDPLDSLLHLSLLHILMAMIPGPNTVVISYLAASDSRRSGLGAATGVCTASVVWVSLALAGAGVALMEAGMVYRLLRLAGALYLIYVGLRMLWAARKGVAVLSGKPRPSRRSPFLSGLLTTFGNPKSAVFWTSVFLLVVPAGAPAWFYFAVVALIGAQSLLWYGSLALLMSSGPARRGYTRFAAWLDRAAGAIMVMLGLKVAADLR